ncbi:hypothetical protein EHI8A_150750 [Entamoeba histolytica HM-1:IMSS-B]|uniref:DH domain-containing protein n=6 Tax=Entamoeba histolytica TaxID=5759 RepID=C4M9L5_ENTH1|nr:hypothetical protein EHI_022260 [Entamoeba histolytica HM-1:IMSS]EMD46434.1 Hypothetical protein EHI5A_179270 [Entamoeba histolytica KU27]EMH77963.1 hypothetical protein EHI8A_150750 [Entamoeba histolytica HM-1:IMSS-B]EMS12041.1 hypothetical protein KM1_234010 [Entamoeba histolytica HM-3:IMSS]ENY64000.1 hypothetical protein EHI7A_137400 [Entamoeba histolytica HM-1:IMSS-A]GAT98372.1 hypothetical protein CL6EHI_022260 [Entamoeba histolytica]|eukprot:XP_649854.1 hypothetical protein EHI_022260 [Entamoeba histolytica HM-1:IMSS]
MNELQNFCLEELQPKEVQLLNKLHCYLRGSTEQAEQGFEIMSDALENVGFKNFLKKVKPSLYTDCLLSSEIDIVNATLNFLILLSEENEISEHVIRHDDELANRLNPLVSNEETVIAALHVINGFISVAEKLDNALPRTPRRHSINCSNISQFIILIPALNRHLQTYDPVQMSVYQCLIHILRIPNAKSIFLRENGAERIADLITGGNDGIISGCSLINTLLTNEEEHTCNTFNLILLKANIIASLLIELNSEAVGECLKALEIMAKSKIVVNAIAASPNILTLIDCLKFPPEEPNTIDSLKDALEITSLLAQNKTALTRFREVGFTLVLSDLLSNFNELNDRMQILLLSTLMDCTSDEHLMNELNIYNVEILLKLISLQGIANDIKTKILTQFAYFKQHQPILEPTQITLETAKQEEELKNMEKAMDITKKRLSQYETAYLSSTNTSQPEDFTLNSSTNHNQENQNENNEQHKTMRVPRKTLAQRKKRNAIIMKGFQVEDLAQHYGESIPPEPSTVIIPRVLKRSEEVKQNENNSIQVTSSQVSDGTTTNTKDNQKEESDKIISPRNKKEQNEKGDNEESKLLCDRLSLNRMKMPSIELISAEGNKEQLTFVSQLNAQSKNRGVCLNELYESQVSFNKTMNKIITVVIPQLIKINKEFANIFPSFERLAKFHEQLEIDLKVLVDNNQKYDVDVCDVISKMLNNSEFMKEYERYWINIEMDKVRTLREQSDTSKKLKEFDKEGLIVEKLILLPMDRFRRFIPIIDAFVHNTPDCCVEHDNIVKAYSDIVYLIAFFDEKRQIQQGLAKIKKLQKEVEGFDVIGVVLSDIQLCVKVGKKPETLKVIVVGQDNGIVQLIGIKKKKKTLSVKWKYIIDKSTILIPNDNKITITTKDQTGKSCEITLTFKFSRECDEWYQMVLKTLNNC